MEKPPFVAFGKERKQMRNSFDETVCEIVNDTLNGIFTETATKITYQHLDELLAQTRECCRKCRYLQRRSREISLHRRAGNRGYHNQTALQMLKDEI
jgi:hypothetical protein